MAEARIERRLAAILAADVAGYSRLMGTDEVGTLAALKAHRREIVDPAIAAHKGRIVKTTGDGMLVEFASAVDAVTCAVAVQEKMAARTAEGAEPRIQFRFGINVGDIIIDGDDIFGDGVNVAARVENECEPGRVYLSDDVYRQVRGKTAFAIDNLGERSLKNIDRPVRLYAVRSAAYSVEETAKSPAEASKALPLPDKPSIAVLPFDNMSGDPEQEYFADGIVEDITTELSRFQDLFVIARNSSFHYKGRSPDVRQVGCELGVRYLLEGSVRRGRERVRISAQLIDAATGGHLWAEKYDHDYSELFALQDRVTASVVNAIRPEILIGEGRRAARKTPANLDAFESCMRGIWHSYHFTREENLLAESWLRRSIEIDPKLARAHVRLARLLAGRCWSGSSNNIELELQESEQLAERALALDDRDPECYFALSILALMGRQYNRALSTAQQAIDLNQNFPLGFFALGETRIFMGQFAEALEPMARCTELSPTEPFTAYFLSFVSLAHYHLRNYDEAIRYSEMALQRRQSYALLRTMLAGLGQTGRTDEARAALIKIDRLKPSNFKRYWQLTCPYADPSHEAHLIDGLRKAGYTFPMSD